MKKSFIISGILTLIVLVLFITDTVSFGNEANAALAQGNRHYAAGDLQKAHESYATGLENAPQDPALNYNAAQALYSLKEFGQALGYYEKAALKKADRYLNMGNSCLRLADTASEENQKQQLYQQALQVYLEGILEFPQEVSLKYNYEYVKEKLQQQQQNNEENQENNQDQNNNEDQNNDQSQNSSEDQQGENQDKQNQSQDGNEENQEQKQDQNSDENSGQDGSEDQQEGQQESQSGENSEDKEDSSEGSSEESRQSLGEIEQALRALEQQEADSLKNNQAIRGSGKEDKYDW